MDLAALARTLAEGLTNAACIMRPARRNPLCYAERYRPSVLYLVQVIDNKRSMFSKMHNTVLSVDDARMTVRG